MAGPVSVLVLWTILSWYVEDLIKALKQPIVTEIILRMVYPDMQKFKYEDILKMLLGLTDEEIGKVKDLTGPYYEKAKGFMEYLKDLNLTVAVEAARVGYVSPYAASVYARLWNNILWSFGVGWLSWGVMSPFVNVLIARPLERALNRIHRPGSMTVSQALDAWRRGLIDEETLNYILSTHGLPDWDIEVLKQLEYKELTKSELEKLYKHRLITEKEFVDGLKRLGYKEADARLILQTIKPERTKEERDLTKSEILRAYRYRVINRATAKNYLKQLGYSDDEADLILKVEDTIMANRTRELTYSQIRQMFLRGVLTENEAKSYLQRIGYTLEDTELLIDLWKKQAEPRPKTLNLTTIKYAYLYDIIDSEKAKAFLSELGYTEDQIELLISLWDTQKEKEPRKPSVSQIMRMLRYNIITEDEAIKKLVELGYTEEDAKNIVKSYQIQPVTRERRITRYDVVRAWRNGWITAEEAVQILMELGYSEDDAWFILMSYTKRE